MFNILTEPLVRFDSASGARVFASLPEIYSALMSDEVEAFPALRPHQRHAWHAFLVQLGALAASRNGAGGFPSDAPTWTDLLRGLTPDFPGDEPWQLVLEDICKPAFMQPPASSEERLADYRGVYETPDELDVLATSKNHDLKSAIAVEYHYDDLIMALISLQTSAGFSGAGNYGISRMNGGLGSRPAFSITPSARHGVHVRRDMEVLHMRREEMLEDSLTVDGGAALLWKLPWDGSLAEALPLSALDPFYIEVCRRIRLRLGKGGRLRAIRATSRATRIDAKALRGVTGDPWTPIDRGGGKSLTLSAGGFDYRRIVDYLVNWEHPTLCSPTRHEMDSSDTMQLVARGMVRGQGRTEGYHERKIPIRQKMRSAMLNRAEIEDLGGIASERIADVGTVHRMLSHAIQTFLAKGATGNFNTQHRIRARHWLNRLDEMVNARFFEDLQQEYESEDRDTRQSIRNEWLLNQDGTGVVDRAREILADALESLPCPGVERYKARVFAEGLFEGRLRGEGGLSALFTDRTESNGGRGHSMDARNPNRTTGIPAWGEIATRVAWTMAQHSFPRRDLEELRRMGPRSIDSPAYQRLREDEELFGTSGADSPEAERKWSLILHGLAVMTPNSSGIREHRTAHNELNSVGHSLYFGGDLKRNTGFYREARLNGLLNSRGERLRALLAYAFRKMAAARATFDWREMANFIHSDGSNEVSAEQYRRRIARDYFLARFRPRLDNSEIAWPSLNRGD